MDEPKNVVLVTVDCLRPDHLTLYGYDRPTDPFLSKFADDGVVFEHAYTTGPGTSVAFPSILTGTYPFEYGGYGRLSADRPTIAETLSSDGIDTVGVHSNTYLSRTFDYERGFDSYESFYDRPSRLVRFEDRVGSLLGNDPISRLVKQTYETLLDSGGTAGPNLPYEPADETTGTALQMIEQTEGRSFLWLHYMDVHAPHHPPDRHLDTVGGAPRDWEQHHDQWLTEKNEPGTVDERTLERFVEAYDAEVRFVDEQLERLVEGMRALDRHEETLYIVTADHGELLGEHGRVSHPPRLHDELIHVPLVVHYPGVTDGFRSESLVSLLDVPQTVADAFGLDRPSADRGRSLLPALDGEAVGREAAFAQVSHEPGEGFSAGEYVPEKAIVACLTQTGRYVLDRQRDNESFSDGVDETERERLRELVEEHLSGIETDTEFSEAAVDDETAQRLRELGYVE